MAVQINPAVVGLSLSPSMAVRIDEASTTVTYIGKAPVGSDDASAVWQILRFSETGTVTACEFADGDAYFDNVWDDRASLNYS